jgi:zinc transport system permease protein
MTHLLLQIQQALAFAFIQRALIAGCLIALACSALGFFLILRRLSLIGDGIAHVSFAAIALGLMLNVMPLALAVPIAVIAALFIWELGQRTSVHSDTALGIISAVSVALGVILASVGKGFNVDLFSYLFGSILAVTRQEVAYAAILCLCVIFLIAFFYQELFAVSFDEEYARASGVRSGRVNRILVVLTAITVVLGIKLVGTMLVSSLIVLPAASSLQVAGSFRSGLTMGAAFAMISVLVGILAAYALNLPAGGMIVCVNFLFFLSACVFAILRRSFR